MPSRIAEPLRLFPTSEQEVGYFLPLCSALGVHLGPNWPERFGAAVRAWAENTMDKPVRTLSLFSGAGGLDVGFHDAGFQIHQMVELDERFAATLRANRGDGKYLGMAGVVCGDVRDFRPPSDLAVDFIIGGPPCQSFSAAGRRAAGVQGTDDARGNLFEEYVRLLKQLKPKAFLFENVYGIVGAQGGRAWDEIQGAFETAGYRLHHRILDAADFGVPQHRERMFIVGTVGECFKFPRPTHGPDSPDGIPYSSASEAVAGAFVTASERAATVGGRFGSLLSEIPPGLNYSFFTAEMGHTKPIFAWRSKFSDFLYKADPDTPSRTLKAQGGQYTGPFHWDNRPFAIGELKRLQTFPDSYEIVGGRQATIHQIGNSVPPQLARIIALAILDQIFGVRPPVALPTLERGAGLGFRKRKRGFTAVYRSKAKDALALAGPVPEVRSLREHVYAATLTEDFDFRIQSDAPGALNVAFTPGDAEWHIDVSRPESASGRRFSLTVSKSSGGSWGLRVPSVRLSGMLEERGFTAAWKAFELELVRSQIKADLVQLCGYYQYKPSFHCAISFGPGPVPGEWRALQKLIEGSGVKRILRHHDAALLWGMEPSSVLDFAFWLRRLGYEVRNRNTNPQIPPDSLLVPYAFPTLNPKSVQLRKCLSELGNG